MDAMGFRKFHLPPNHWFVVFKRVFMKIKLGVSPNKLRVKEPEQSHLKRQKTDLNHTLHFGVRLPAISFRVGKSWCRLAEGRRQHWGLLDDDDSNNFFFVENYCCHPSTQQRETIWWINLEIHMSHEKKPLTFHHTGCSIEIPRFL